MPQISMGTLMVAIQSVRDTIKDLELLLESETLRDRAAIEELVVSYDRAASDLKDAYLAAIASGVSNFPPYEELLRPSSIPAALRPRR